jgi:hypothetical protein
MTFQRPTGNHLEHKIACIHRYNPNQVIAPCVLTRHPDWYDGPGSPGTARLNKHGFWSPSKNAIRKQGSPQVQHQYNYSLSEMRQYSDSTIVLVLSQGDGPTEEADYPIDIDLDTSTLLEDEGAVD